MNTTDATKPDIRFAVTITDTGYAYDRQTYRHFAARAYVLGVDKYGSTGRPELLSPTDYSVPESGKVRALAGLEITAQADSDSMRRRGDEWYAWTVAYDRHRIELKDAEEILPILRKITRRIEALTAEHGRPATLAQFCSYAVKAITGERQPFMRKVPDSQDYEGHGYRSMDTDALSYHLQSDATEWRKNHGIDLDSAS
jgi:hypothetical protein